MIKDGEFLEHAQFGGNFYGTRFLYLIFLENNFGILAKKLFKIFVIVEKFVYWMLNFKEFEILRRHNLRQNIFLYVPHQWKFWLVFELKDIF